MCGVWVVNPEHYTTAHAEAQRGKGLLNRTVRHLGHTSAAKRIGVMLYLIRWKIAHDSANKTVLLHQRDRLVKMLERLPGKQMKIKF